MEQPVGWPQKFVSSNWTRKFTAAVYGLAFFACLMHIMLHVATSSLSEADGVRVMAMTWMVTGYLSFLRASRLEDGLDKVIEATKITVETLSLENQALSNSYNNVVETLDRIDKRVLMKHGISISLTKPEKLKN
jgi:hypothetical protein